MARARLAHGWALASRAMLTEAEETLHQGLLAAERSGRDELAAKIVLAQAFTAGRLRDRGLAATRLDRARARLQGLGSVDPRQVYELELRAGDVARMSGHDRDAIDTWERLAEGLGDDRRSQRQRASLDHRLGTAYYNLGEFERATELWTRARTTWSLVTAPNHPKIAELDTNLAYGAYYDGRCEEARDRVRAALEQLEGTMGEEAPNLIPAVSILARAHGCLGEHEEAIALRRRTLEMTIRRYGSHHAITFEESLRLAEAHLMASQFEAAKAVLEPLEPKPEWLDEDPFLGRLFDVIDTGVEERAAPTRSLSSRERG